MEKIYLVNVKLINNNVNFELYYASDCLNKDTLNIELKGNNIKYETQYKFSNYNDINEKAVVKILLSFKIADYGKIEITKNGKTLEIWDNKNEKIVNDGSQYIIFYKNYKIEINSQYINFSLKKMFDKLKYEVNKQIYSIKKYKKIAIYRLFKKKCSDNYLFNDRMLYADDNAEQVFKYINENQKEFSKKCYYVLDKNSKAISRLKKYGKVLKYGSIMHKLKYINCRMVVSSHSSYYDNCFNPFNKNEMDIYKDLIRKEFFFVQHGIIMNDVHKFSNRGKIIADRFVTSTYQENEYLKTSNYMYEPEMIIKTGLPRFDILVSNPKNIILIAPTWRENLSDKKYNDEEKKEFKNSEYYKKYRNILSNKLLLDKLKQSNYKIKFLLHPVFAKYSEEFEDLKSENIDILNLDNERYSNLFNECSIFVTDYSSTHFDVATELKPIIYYQFDKESFFKSHYQKGYFDYENDGFGDVITDEKKIIEKLIFYIDNNKIEDKYIKRIKNTFFFLDKENSKRVYNEIIKLSNENAQNYRFNTVH